jgi:hypothetical protein
MTSNSRTRGVSRLPKLVLLHTGRYQFVDHLEPPPAETLIE